MSLKSIVGSGVDSAVSSAESALDSVLSSIGGGLVTSILSTIGDLFGPTYWQQRYDKMNSSFSNADDICKAYIINISNGTFNNNDFNQFQEMFGYKAPSQGHGWRDRTNEVKYETMIAFNELGNQRGLPSDWLFQQTTINAMAQTVKPLLQQNFQTKPTDTDVIYNYQPPSNTQPLTFWQLFNPNKNRDKFYLVWTVAIGLLSGLGYLIKKAFFNNKNKKR